MTPTLRYVKADVRTDRQIQVLANGDLGLIQDARERYVEGLMIGGVAP